MAESKIVICDATILTLDDEDHFHYPGTLVISNDVITGVYDGKPREEDLKGESITIIDGTNLLVMPGLVDLHFHTSVAKVCHLIAQGFHS